MKLYACWTTVQLPRPPRGHPCHNAYAALRDAGHDPEVIKVQGLGIGPRFTHWTTDGRKEVERISGQRAVPVLVTDEGEVVTDSRRIVEWRRRIRRRRAPFRRPDAASPTPGACLRPTSLGQEIRSLRECVSIVTSS